jgi:hypothetical protein
MTALREALARRGYAGLRLKCRHTMTDARVFIEAGWTDQPAFF